jgi:hypothetical protein
VALMKKERMMQGPRAGVIQREQDSSPEERDRRREEAARELEDLKRAWLHAYQAQGIDPKTVNYDALLLEEADRKIDVGQGENLDDRLRQS